MRRKLLRLIRRFLGHSWVHLPLTVVVVGPTQDLNALPHVLESVAHMVAFFSEKVGIRLQVKIIGLQSTLVPTGLFLDSLLRHHYWLAQVGTPAVYVWPLLDRVGQMADNLGEAFVEQGLMQGIAIVAGNVLIPGSGDGPGGRSQLDEIMAHELGHLLLGNGEHEEGTFMRTPLELIDRTVTKAQRRALRAAAYRLGGL